jgi:hypothetical protein
MTGNGDFDGATQWGESFLKLKYTPPAGAAAGSLQVIDHWTPWTDLQRSGQQVAPAVKMAGMSAPSEALKPVGSGMNMKFKGAKVVTMKDDQGVPVTLVYPQMASGAWSDEDFGSAGPACVFAIGVCVAAGKDGIAYPVKTANLGGTTLITQRAVGLGALECAVPLQQVRSTRDRWRPDLRAELQWRCRRLSVDGVGASLVATAHGREGCRRPCICGGKE